MHVRFLEIAALHEPPDEGTGPKVCRPCPPDPASAVPSPQNQKKESTGVCLWMSHPPPEGSRVKGNKTMRSHVNIEGDVTDSEFRSICGNVVRKISPSADGDTLFRSNPINSVAEPKRGEQHLILIA